MPAIRVMFGGRLDEVDGGAKVFGEADVDGASLTDADVPRYKDAIVSAAQLAWYGGAFTPAKVMADPAPFCEAVTNMMMMTLAGDMATCKIATVTVVGTEPAEPKDNVTLNDTVKVTAEKTAKVVGAILVGGVDDLAKAKQYALEATASGAGMEITEAAQLFDFVARTTRDRLREDGNPAANVKVMFLQVIG